MTDILFITGTRVGDAVLSTGLLGHLIEKNPDVRVTVACGAVAAPLFAAVPNLRRVIAMRKQPRGGHWLSLWASCVGTWWHTVVDLRGSAMAYLLPAARRYVKRPSKGQGLHVVEQLARTLGLEANPPGPRLWTAPEHGQAAERLIPSGGPVLGLGPAANWRGKEWPGEKFFALARRLTAPDGILPGARVAVFGAEEDRPRTDPVLAALPPDRRIDLVGRADLLTAFACLRRCALYIGNDSGIMHMAAAAGTPTLGLFGPSKEGDYRPWGPHTDFIRTPETYDELIGRPGYDHRTTGTMMGNLAVETVEAAANALWRRRGEAAA
ncbi:MAG: glycosyltransferase family 9 protein [Alphaproteobacteria bacterium]|nr:glycosyltransferase family 9 protein [Alphaproteobacteria bacterium]